MSAKSFIVMTIGASTVFAPKLFSQSSQDTVNAIKDITAKYGMNAPEGDSIYYTFEAPTMKHPGSGIKKFAEPTTEEKESFRKAFQEVSNATNATFKEVTPKDGKDAMKKAIRVFEAQPEPPFKGNVSEIFFMPGRVRVAQTQKQAQKPIIDAISDVDPAYMNYMTHHAVMHALGYNDPNMKMPASLNHTGFTVMSDSVSGGNPPDTFGPGDIAALQERYGVHGINVTKGDKNATGHPGFNIYNIEAGSDTTLSSFDPKKDLIRIQGKNSDGAKVETFRNASNHLIHVQEGSVKTIIKVKKLPEKIYVNDGNGDREVNLRQQHKARG